MNGIAVLVAALAWGVPKEAYPPVPSCRRRAPQPEAVDGSSPRAAALAALEAARARAGSASAVVRDITLPSIERLIEDADLRAANITAPERDHAFVRRTWRPRVRTPTAWLPARIRTERRAAWS